MKKLIFLIAISSVAYAEESRVVSSTTYQGPFTPQVVGQNQQQNTQEPFTISYREFVGRYTPSYGNGVVLGNTPIRASVKAPNGHSNRYIETTGYSWNEYEVTNYNEGSIQCKISRMMCMQSWFPSSCVTAQEIVSIPKNKTYKDKGSRLFMTYMYQASGLMNTEAFIFFEQCTDASHNVRDIGSIMVAD